MRSVDTDVRMPIAGCTCGWVSHSFRYGLAYHAEQHKCPDAIKAVKARGKMGKAF